MTYQNVVVAKVARDSKLLLHLLLSVYMNFHSDIILLPLFLSFSYHLKAGDAKVMP